MNNFSNKDEEHEFIPEFSGSIIEALLNKDNNRNPLREPLKTCIHTRSSHDYFSIQFKESDYVYLKSRLGEGSPIWGGCDENFLINKQGLIIVGGIVGLLLFLFIYLILHFFVDSSSYFIWDVIMGIFAIISVIYLVVVIFISPSEARAYKRKKSFFTAFSNH